MQAKLHARMSQRTENCYRTFMEPVASEWHPSARNLSAVKTTGLGSLSGLSSSLSSPSWC